MLISFTFAIDWLYTYHMTYDLSYMTYILTVDYLINIVFKVTLPLSTTCTYNDSKRDSSACKQVVTSQ